jgi:hypothetical protein
MAENSERIPPKERGLKRSETDSFGICDGCGNNIYYPAIRFPTGCQEISSEKESKLGYKRYHVDYADMHVSCATKRLIDSGDIGVEIKSEVMFKKEQSYFDKRALKRVAKNKLISHVESDLEIDTFQFNSIFKDKKDE